MKQSLYKMILTVISGVFLLIALAYKPLILNLLSSMTWAASLTNPLTKESGTALKSLLKKPASR